MMAQTGKLPSGGCFYQKEMMPCRRIQKDEKMSSIHVRFGTCIFRTDFALGQPT